jgi:O-acetylhomoserine (thiol)-lyase
MDTHMANAKVVAQFLASHPAIEWVRWAGLADHPDHARAQRYLPLGPGAVFSFGVRGGRRAGRCFIESLELCSPLANIGDARTLIIHPASTTHQQLSDAALEAAGVPPDLVRISVGLEDAEDIVWDLDQALNVLSRER